MATTAIFVSSDDTLPRERVLGAAYDLFRVRGIRDVAVGEVAERAGVAEVELFEHFPTKDDLVLAVLDRREQLWTIGLVEAEARKRATTGDEQLLAIFDVFDEWFHADDFDGCTFINVLLEMGWDHPLGKACIDRLANIRELITRLATESGLRDVDELTHSWHLLMKGSIVAAAEGDLRAAQRARLMGADLLARHS